MENLDVELTYDEENDDEINKYFIDHNLSDKNKIEYILKSGLPCQKLCLFSNFHFYTYNKDIFQFFLKSILDNTNIFNEEIHVIFSRSLLKFFKEFEPKIIDSYFTENLYNSLILFFVRIISDKNISSNISEEYTKSFAELVVILSVFKLNISKNVIDYVVKFGKTGTNAIEKRFCVFFCSQLIQIDNNDNNELISGFISLYNDFENCVRREVAYQLRFLSKVKNQDYFNRNLLTIYKKYIEETEISIQVEAIISILENFDKVYDDDNFNKRLIEILMNLVSSNNVEKKPYLKKITKLVQTIMTISKDNIQVAQVLEKDVNFIINKFILTDMTKIDINFAFYFIEEFYLYSSYLNNFKEFDKLSSLTGFLIKTVFSQSFVRIPHDFFDENGVRPTHKALKLCFLENIENIFKFLPNDILNKYITGKYFAFFDSTTLPDTELLFVWFKNMNKTVMLCESYLNNEFFTVMQKYFQEISETFLKLDQLEWRVKKDVLLTFRQSELLYKGEDFIEKAYTIVLKNLKEEDNYKLQEECAKQIIFLLKHGTNTLREEISALCIEYANSNNFYKRRLFIPMFEEALSILSINFMKKSLLLHYYLKLLDNDHPLILNKLIRLLPSIYPLINNDKVVKLQITSELLDINDNVKDLETKISIRKFTKWLENFEKNKHLPEITKMLEYDKVKEKHEEKVKIVSMKCFQDYNHESVYGPGVHSSLKNETSINLLNVLGGNKSALSKKSISNSKLYSSNSSNLGKIDSTSNTKLYSGNKIPDLSNNSPNFGKIENTSKYFSPNLVKRDITNLDDGVKPVLKKIPIKTSKTISISDKKVMNVKLSPRLSVDSNSKTLNLVKKSLYVKEDKNK